MVAYPGNPGNPGSIRVASPPPEPARHEPERVDKDSSKFWSQEQGGRRAANVPSSCNQNMKS